MKDLPKPKIKESNARTKWLGVRVTPEVYEEIQERKARGEDMARWHLELLQFGLETLKKDRRAG